MTQIYPKLSDPVQVAYGSTVGIITCVDNKKIYIDGVYAHAGYGASCSYQIYIVPNGGTTDSEKWKIYDNDLGAGGNDRFHAYTTPFVLQNSGDALFIGSGEYQSSGTGATCNVLITGYRDS